MQDPHNSAPSRDPHGKSLVAWFASLSPEQRLAELESRVTLFWSLRYDEDAADDDPGRKALGRSKDRAVAELLEAVLRSQEKD